MTNNDELALNARDQHLPARYYLAECQECGEIMPSNKLHESRNTMAGDSDCYCPYCNAADCDIDDLGTGDEPAARAWNFQQKRIEALLADRDADKALIAELAGHLKNAHAFIENTEALGQEAASGILKCGGEEWNVDASKNALAAAGITLVVGGQDGNIARINRSDA